MKLKKTLAVLLTLLLALGSTAAYAAEPFTDVAEDAYYAEAVTWAAEQNITQGRGNGIFDPDATVTRAEAVTFLWRMAGEPEPTQTETFEDVEADANNWWYKTAVQWAAENGITNGTGNGKFSPKTTCSRGMILTMIYRMEGCPWDEAANAALPDSEDMESWTLEDYSNAIVQKLVEAYRSEDGFIDVKAGAYYELPIYWALMCGIISEEHIDIEPLAAHPAAACPRGEMVFFIYRAEKYEAAMRGEGDPYVPDDAVEIGTVPETVLLDQDGVKITLNSIESDGYDAVMTCTFENGTDKLLSVDFDDCAVNTFVFHPSAYVLAKEAEYTFYIYSVAAAPGETIEFYGSLSYLKDKGISAIGELELSMNVYEAEKSEDGDWYDIVDDYAQGESVRIETSLYEEGVSYDLEGDLIYEADDLKLLVCKAENDEYSGPELSIYACNSGSEDVFLEIASLKLDGEEYEAYFSMTVPAGKRCVEDVYLDIDYENIPVVTEGEITMVKCDPESWETVEVFEPATFRFDA